MSHTQSMNEHGESAAVFAMLNIDSADPARLARFYAAALGWDVTYGDDSCQPFCLSPRPAAVP